ncbi:sigma-70 family RNA polymerase sigma factor [Solwaraspora sp. WMMB335]|uniref:sigma-70 family RNA polymerase sigma factor n=1 Tax=Solwaraspora sp. WMMB335 TaxID=3404118 RepID=UPI003B9536DE
MDLHEADVRNPRTESSRDAALRAVIEQHREMLLGYCIRLTGGDRHMAEDVVQETFVKAWQHVEKLTAERGSVRGWLKQVAHNIAVDQHRAARRRPPEIELAGVAEPPAREDVTGGLTRIALDDALGVLPAEHRIVLVEMFLRDRTAAQVARRLGIPLGTVKSRIFYGLRRLRGVVDRTLLVG